MPEAGDHGGVNRPDGWSFRVIAVATAKASSMTMMNTASGICHLAMRKRGVSEP